MLVLIHNREDKMWTSMLIPPLQMTSLQLELSNNSEITMVDVMLTEIRTTSIDKLNSPCMPYKSSDFNVCSQNFFTAQLKDSINCTLPGKSFMFLTFGEVGLST